MKLGSQRFTLLLSHEVLSASVTPGTGISGTGRQSSPATRKAKILPKVGDLGLIPRSGRPPGEGNGSLLQYSYLENSMDRGAWRATVHAVAKNGHD